MICSIMKDSMGAHFRLCTQAHYRLNLENNDNIKI